jgi:hypothetical protein
MTVRHDMDMRTLSWAIIAVLSSAEKAGVDIETVIDTIRAQSDPNRQRRHVHTNCPFCICEAR